MLFSLKQIAQNIEHSSQGQLFRKIEKIYYEVKYHTFHC